MTRISDYHHLSLTVTDLDKSTEWYGEVLGFSHDADIEGDGFRRTRLHHPNGSITADPDATRERVRRTVRRAQDRA